MLTICYVPNTIPGILSISTYLMFSTNLNDMLILPSEFNLPRVIQLVSKEMGFRLYILAPKTNALNYAAVPSHDAVITSL